MEHSKYLYLVRFILFGCLFEKYIFSYSRWHATAILIRYLHEEIRIPLDDIPYETFDIIHIPNLLK